MSKFAVFNQDGTPRAFYDEALHGARTLPVYGEDDHDRNGPIIGEIVNPDCLIPLTAVPISVEQWLEFMTFPGQRRWNGAVVMPYTPPSPPLTSADIDAERDRRIAAGFMFAGKLYQARDQDLRNINGASTGASVAIAQGAQAGDVRWTGGDEDFGWIAADNTIVPMDAPTVIVFGLAAMSHVSRLTMTGRTLKNRLAAGEDLDIADDTLWV